MPILFNKYEECSEGSKISPTPLNIYEKCSDGPKIYPTSFNKNKIK
jgi:hypothetical protein